MNKPVHALDVVLAGMALGGAALCLAPAVLEVSWSIPAPLAGGLAVGALAVLAWRLWRRVRLLRGHVFRHRAELAEAERHYFEVLRNIVRVVEGREKSTRGRSERIGRLAEEMGTALGLAEDRARLLGLVAQVHDIGMLSVPERIMQKAAHLAANEFQSVQAHPQIGHEVLAPLSFLTPVLGAVLHHHERMNGTGYPAGLAGQAIPLEARILAVVDAYEAMTHDQPYRPALAPPSAVRELVRCADDGFDRDCVTALARAVHLDALLPAGWSEPAPVGPAEPQAQLAP